MPFAMVAATSLAAVVPTSAFGAYQHVKLGTVDGRMVIRLSASGIVGALLGALAVNMVPVGAFRAVCAAFLVLAAVRMVLTSKRASPEDPAPPKRWALPGAPAGLVWLPVPVRAVAPHGHQGDATPRQMVRAEGSDDWSEEESVARH
jgi:uncharacterized membrane protein YfcA